ncbi:YfaZ family outer membrane protein [Sulfuricurvum sp.]|uniref:YfaZ family outer membrane protein n=1 Tax=Sulfuricurvum sp. TaxID=2025608 RepID=UPI002E31B860|nr:YfaZ family outer membrane protein [Sulfuricurvum sp.]HEX5328602.1 YfaZ family outer membrane protein [Sulfuricurvum sp.]
MLKKIILTLMVSTSAFAAHQVSVNVNDKDVGGELRLDMGRMGNAMSNAYIGARFLSGDNNNSQTINDPDPLMEVSFMVMEPVRGVSGLKLGLGVKGEYTKIDGENYAAIPLGIEAELQLPLNTPFPFYLNGAFYYAPSVLSFKKGDSYTESRIGLDIEPIQNARIGVGYRLIDTDLTSRNVTYNDAWYFGMRLDF